MPAHALSPAYLTALAGQIASLSAFFGGFAATIFVALVLAPPSRPANWAAGLAAVAATAFVVAVVAMTMVLVGAHPEAPPEIARHAALATARTVGGLGFVLGTYLLLAAVGTAGWIHGRRLGLTTSIAAGVAALLVSWAVKGF